MRRPSSSRLLTFSNPWHSGSGATSPSLERPSLPTWSAANRRPNFLLLKRHWRLFCISMQPQRYDGDEAMMMMMMVVLVLVMMMVDTCLVSSLVILVSNTNTCIWYFLWYLYMILMMMMLVYWCLLSGSCRGNRQAIDALWSNGRPGHLKGRGVSQTRPLRIQ